MVEAFTFLCKDTGILITNSCSIHYWGCNDKDQNKAKPASQNTKEFKFLLSLTLDDDPELLQVDNTNSSRL